MGSLVINKLNAHDSEYQMVSSLFHKTSATRDFSLKIKFIDRVDNHELKRKFEVKKREYEEMYGIVRVVKVFHGTKKSNIPNILINNLEVRRHGQNIGQRYGAGVSFSAFSSYASHYCDKFRTVKHMLLCNVLVSQMITVPEEKNSSALIEPPLIENCYPLRYDTTAKDKAMSVIVKYEDHTYYPAYIIYFEKVSKVSPSPSMPSTATEMYWTREPVQEAAKRNHIQSYKSIHQNVSPHYHIHSYGPVTHDESGHYIGPVVARRESILDEIVGFVDTVSSFLFRFILLLLLLFLLFILTLFTFVHIVHLLNWLF